MTHDLERQFLDYSVSRLRELTGRIEACLGMLDEDRIWMRGSKNENAVGNLVLHLCGNVRQWIVSGLGGAADLRQRDSEFAATGGSSVPDLTHKLKTTVDEATHVIQSLTSEQLAARQIIQGYDVSGLEIVYHVVEHFSMHTGQVLFAAKMLTGADLGFYRHLRGASGSQTHTA